MLCQGGAASRWPPLADPDREVEGGRLDFLSCTDTRNSSASQMRPCSSSPGNSRHLPVACASRKGVSKVSQHHMLRAHRTRGIQGIFKQHTSSCNELPRQEHLHQGAKIAAEYSLPKHPFARSNWHSQPLADPRSKARNKKIRTTLIVLPGSFPKKLCSAAGTGLPGARVTHASRNSPTGRERGASRRMRPSCSPGSMCPRPSCSRSARSSGSRPPGCRGPRPSCRRVCRTPASGKGGSSVEHPSLLCAHPQRPAPAGGRQRVHCWRGILGEQPRKEHPTPVEEVARERTIAKKVFAMENAISQLGNFCRD